MSWYPQFAIQLTCISLKPLIKVFIYSYLFSFVIICVHLFFDESLFFHENFFESFLCVRISSCCVNVSESFLSVKIFFMKTFFGSFLSVRISFLWELFLNSFYLWKSFAFFFISEISFLSVYENSVWMPSSIYFIIKTRLRLFLNFISSYFMCFTLNSSYFVPHYFFVK